MKRLKSQILFVLFPALLLAQQDTSDIRQRILESEDTDQMLIQKTRDFIYNRLRSGDIGEAHKAYDYAINHYEKESLKPFWLVEKSLLGYWFGEYEILYAADSIESTLANDRKEYIYPQKDKLALELRKLCAERRVQSIQRIDSLVADREKRDYLILFLIGLPSMLLNRK
jgi:hypothetical protein